MQNHDNWLELADVYAVGALDGDELAGFQRHLPGCEICRDHVHEAEESLTLLPQALPLLTPSTSLKAQIMQALELEEAPVLTVQRQRSFGWSMAAAFALAAVVVVFNWNNVQVESRRLKVQAMMTMVTAPKAKMIELKGLDANPAAKAQLVWDYAKCRGIFMTSGLAALPEGKVYELWAIAGDKPVPAGTFTVDKDGKAVLKCAAQEMNVFDKFAVTMEPAGGLPAPSGPMHLLGAPGA